jgi:hypothetical protein
MKKDKFLSGHSFLVECQFIQRIHSFFSFHNIHLETLLYYKHIWTVYFKPKVRIWHHRRGKKKEKKKKKRKKGEKKKKKKEYNMYL